MVVDEQGFKAFLVKVHTYYYNSIMNPSSNYNEKDWEEIEMNLKSHLDKYYKLYMEPKPSKWKQLNIEGI